jgi:hypothetical protein
VSQLRRASSFPFLYQVIGDLNSLDALYGN